MMPQTTTLDRPATTFVTVPAPRPADPVAFVASLGIGAIAVALHHSDMPTKRPVEFFHSVEQTTTWVMQGIKRVGGVQRLWWLDYSARKLGAKETPWSAAESREYTALRGPRRRRDRCAGQAHHFAYTCGTEIAAFPTVVEVTEVIAYEPGGSVFTRTRRVSQRDHTNLARFTEVNADGVRVYTGPDHWA